MKMIIIVFRVPFLEVLHNNETGIFVNTRKITTSDQQMGERASDLILFLFVGDRILGYC